MNTLEEIVKLAKLYNIEYELQNGWTDRHITPLPQEECNITILTNEGEFTGMWEPFNKNNYEGTDLPSEGFLGTVYVPISDPLFLLAYWNKTKGPLDIPTIGFHAWKDTNNEFQYYKIVTNADSTKS